MSSSPLHMHFLRHSDIDAIWAFGVYKCYTACLPPLTSLFPPHLLSSPEPVWMLSIGHRVTGCILTPTLSILSIAYVTSGSSFPDFVKGLEPLYQNPAIWGSLKFLIAFPFAYHSFNGLRHLVSLAFESVLTFDPLSSLQYWDTGSGYNMKFTYRAGFTALILGGLSAIGLAMYTPSQ